MPATGCRTNLELFMLQRWLHLMAFFFLEPRLLSGKWCIHRDCLIRLRSFEAHLDAAYRRAEKLFRQIGLCEDCGGSCCRGNYSRSTVYDHIHHLSAGLANPPEWGNTLHPTKSWSINHVSEGVCPYFTYGKGCSLEYLIRPMICVWWHCPKIESVITEKEKNGLKEVREQIDRIQWIYTFWLFFGGMGRWVEHNSR